MKKFFITIIFIAFSFAGCSRVDKTISSANIFQGYPCQDNCAHFKTGFETARDKNWKEDSQCIALPEAQQLGCRSYLHEYNLEANQPLGYIFPAATY